MNQREFLEIIWSEKRRYEEALKLCITPDGNVKRGKMLHAARAEHKLQAVNELIEKLEQNSEITEDKTKYWAEERWSNEDLEAALEYDAIEPTLENIEKLRKACISLFDDKTEHNEMIRAKVREIFKVD